MGGQFDQRPLAQILGVRALGIGRVEEHQVEGGAGAGGAWAKVGGVAAMDASGAEQAQRLDIVADSPAGLLAGLDEQAERRAARDGLQAQGPRPGEQIQRPRAVQLARPGGVLQDVEQALARPIRGRPRGLALRGDEGLALVLTGNDAHVVL